jgi:hypothetical protein
VAFIADIPLPVADRGAQPAPRTTRIDDDQTCPQGIFIGGVLRFDGDVRQRAAIPVRNSSKKVMA